MHGDARHLGLCTQVVVPVIAGEIGENDCSGSFINPLMLWLDSQSAVKVPATSSVQVEAGSVRRVRTCSVAAIPRVSRPQLRQDGRLCRYAWPTSR